MSFTEKLRKEAKRKAGYTCCWCQQTKSSLDVHHIVPESEGGSDGIDNAVPLCKECHDTYGSNPLKRKEVRDRRDFWYSAWEKRNAPLRNKEISDGVYTNMRCIRCGTSIGLLISNEPGPPKCPKCGAQMQ